MSRDVDIIIEFRAAHKAKRQTREDARKAQLQYSRLLETLNSKGLKAVGRRGEALGHLFVFVHCPPKLLTRLVKRERESDFLHGLPTTPFDKDAPATPLSPAKRIRLVHRYVTSLPSEGGLGISPGSPDWDLVESVFCLHDREFNQEWIHAWTTSKISLVPEERVRTQFGDSVALYFSFLFGYTRALFIPAIIGTLFYFFGTPYSPLYSILTVLWSITFVEWWRVNERLLALRHGVRGSARVEKLRAEHKPGFSWWRRELRILASLPVILPFACTVFGVLTFNFILESFVQQLYKGPGQQYMSFAPTIVFVALVPRLQTLFQFCATKLTHWENHAHLSSHTASLTLKSFVFTALVAYAGLALTAFVYAPFGEPIMRLLQVGVLHRFPGAANKSSLWDLSANLDLKIDSKKLQNQLFAYTVTNQIINTFTEVGLPFVIRGAKSLLAKKNNSSSSSTDTPARKKVVFEDEQPQGGPAESSFLQRVREEAVLPEYDVFGDYSEMVVQFGYVALWSTIWPLAPLMALLNNILELRSDAFKITVHARRPIPVRTDTIGPWLDILGFLGWLGAVSNAALVYLFCPRGSGTCNANGGTGSLSAYELVHRSLLNATNALSTQSNLNPGEAETKVVTETTSGALWGEAGEAMSNLLLMALLIALASSHAYILVRAAIRHVVERVVWKGSEEVREREESERVVKEVFLKSLSPEEKDVHIDVDVDESKGEGEDVLGVAFWEHDEGIDEIGRISKEA